MEEKLKGETRRMEQAMAARREAERRQLERIQEETNARFAGEKAAWKARLQESEHLAEQTRQEMERDKLKSRHHAAKATIAEPCPKLG